MERGRAAGSIMIQGTSSHVGKSVLCAALCRILRQDGWRVAPFKSQNMALNSYVTPDGKEIGRAQGVQALAAGAVPCADMNPILLKPKAHGVSQVVVLGRAVGDMDWHRYRHEYRDEALSVIRGALQRLRARYDVVVIEGAGSPVEINLKDREIVNMAVADLAGAPVLLAADIDRGGVFASIVGTLELLERHERERVAGVIINKFRGDVSLLEPGLRWFEQRYGKPVLGVIPHLPDIGIDEEDSMGLPAPGGAVPHGAVRYGHAAGAREDALDIVVIQFPYISNFTDFDPLAREQGVSLRHVRSAADLGVPDAVILPGTKNTVADLQFLQQTGLSAAVGRLAADGAAVVGICGGYQMLGAELRDPERVEGDREYLAGLGLLPVRTTFAAEKLTWQVEARLPEEIGTVAPWCRALRGERVTGYEIHMGRTDYLAGAEPLFRLESGARAGQPDGAVARQGRVWGTYLHGIFDNDAFRRCWLNELRRRRGWAPLPLDGAAAGREAALDRLADHVRRHLDMAAVYRIAGLRGGGAA